MFIDQNAQKTNKFYIQFTYVELHELRLQKKFDSQPLTKVLLTLILDALKRLDHERISK